MMYIQFGCAVVAVMMSAVIALPGQTKRHEMAQSPPRLDCYGDPLPPHGLLRVGTVRFTHGARIRGAFFSPDSKTVKAIDAGGTTCVWDIRTGKELSTFSLQTDGHVDLAVLSPDRKTIAGPCGTGIGLWDSNTGKALAVLKDGLPAGIRVLKPAFSRDGKTLFGLAATGQLVCWAVSTGKRRRAVEIQMPKRVMGEEEDLRAIVFSDFSPDRGMIAGNAFQSKAVYLWDTASGKLIRHFRCEAKGFGQVRFSPDGKLLACGCMDGAVRVWRVDTGKLFVQFKNYSMYDFAFSQDGKRLFLRSGQEGFHVYDLATRKRVPRTFPGSEFLGEGGFVISPDGATVVAYSVIGFAESSRLYAWDVHTGRRLGKGYDAPIPFPFRGAMYSPDARSVFLASMADLPVARTYCYSLPTGKRRGTYAGTLLGVGVGGKTIATDVDDEIRGYDVATGKTLWQRKGSRSLTCAELSAGGTKLVVECEDSQLRVIDGRTGKLIKEYLPLPYRHERQAVLPSFRDGSVAYSADLEFAAIAKEKDHLVQILAWKTGKKVCQLKGFPRQDRYSLTFSPRADYLLGFETGSASPRLALWHIPGGERLAEMSVEAFLGFSPDGKFLCLKKAGTLVVWDIKNRRSFHRLRPQGDIGMVAFSADGKTLAAAGETGVTVWEVVTAKVRMHFPRTRSAILGLQFAPDGRTLMTVTDSCVLVWNLAR